ncbi:Internalin-A precursor [Symmachiella dynata]|uniref:Internalin-A n=1 Tax=Symmachiella dynata TaxID=2527995 RepID=A0A517ZM53_9PLAN|nr:hypothetical protein [Symmachiella dynata]QDU43563.1 Internalin-A precursor [Symmachiella dynata]
MTKTTNKSRLPRTGTLMLIAVVLLIGGGGVMVWVPYHRNQTVISEVENLGGTTESKIIRPFWVPNAVDDEHLKPFERVWQVDLHDTQISDVGLESLRGITSLVTLRLENTQISDASLENLRGLTNLENLALTNTQVSDAGLEHLRGLTNLQHLSLTNNHVSDAGLEHLRELTKLSGLKLERAQVSDSGLEHLHGLTNLETLNLFFTTEVTRAGIKKLQKALPGCKIGWIPTAEYHETP